MTDPAILNSYAYATGDVEIATIEARHPDITDPVTGASGALRLASVFASPAEIEETPFFEAKLEATAPLDAGTVVPFNRAPLEIVRPDKTGAGVPQLRLRFSNVDARIAKTLMVASKTTTPVALTFRSFTMATRLGGQPEVIDGFELVNPIITGALVEITARAPDVINIPFHGQYYDQRFPLIGL